MLNEVKSAFGGNKYLAGIGILSLVLALAAPALAVTEGSVTATVTPQNISITVSPGSVAYGTVGVPTADNIPTGDTIINVNNNGNVSENFNIKGANATGPTITWAIVDAAPSGASGTPPYGYNHNFLNCGVGDSTCTTVEAANRMTDAYETLETGVAAAASDYFKLRLSTPTETGGDFSQHSTMVTVLATI